MSSCAGCGEVNPGHARFCLGCGSALEPGPAPREVRKTVTVLFCDLVGSTELGERLDPEALRAVLDRYFDVVREEVHRHGGIVEKFIGDAVMAVFGIPVLHEDDALRAVRAAAAIPGALHEVNAELESRWQVRLRVRIGVSTGEVVAGGATGGGQRLATGDAVNLAARLQALAPPDGVLLGAATYRLVRAAVQAERLDAAQVKGKAEAVQPYRLLRLASSADDAGSRPAAPLLGRRREFEALRSAWEATVADGTPRRRIVVGTAGVGKSRLLAEFLFGSVPGAVVLRGRCLAYGEGITFWPVREMVADAAGWTDDDSADEALGKLADLMPGVPDAQAVAGRVGHLLGLAAETATLQEIFAALARLLETLAGWAPVVVVVDDLHWAEPSLLALLDYVAGAVTGPLLLLGGARPELFDAFPEHAAGPYERLVLEPLDEEDAAELLDRLLAPAVPPQGVRAHVLAAAEGNPFFVEQFVGMLLDEGILRRETGTWVLSGAVAPGVLPASISTLLAARLERLAPAEQREIEAGSVVGRVFWRGAVAELAQEVVGPDAGRHLQGLVDRLLIVPEPSSFPDDEAYKFQHVLIRDAAYAAMSKTDRATAHQRFAEWLVRMAGDRVGEYDEILGYHLERAVRLREEIGFMQEDDREVAVRAGRHLAAAGDRALARSDGTTSVPLLQRAAALLAADPGVRVDVLTNLGDALFEVGRLDEARTTLSEAVDTAVALGDPRREFRARLALVDRLSFMDPEWSPEDAWPTLDQAVSVLADLGDDPGLAQAWWLVGRMHMDGGRVQAAQTALERARTHARRAGLPRASANPTMWLTMTFRIGPTPVDVAQSRLEEFSADARDHPDVQIELLATAACLAAMRREFDRARHLAETARRLHADRGMVVQQAAGALIEYEIALREGDLAVAEGRLRASDRTLEEMGEVGLRSTIVGMLAHAVGARGDAEEALHWADLAERLTQSDDMWSEVLWRTARAKALAAQGHDDAATVLAGEAVALVEDSDWICLQGNTLLDLAEVHRLSGRPDEARTAAEAALDRYAVKGDLASSDRVHAFLTALPARA
jgi:class 3 adenylate cyclase/tetratricopeptide (TPR) repeat protein